jgi:hypothetical protein
MMMECGSMVLHSQRNAFRGAGSGIRDQACAKSDSYGPTAVSEQGSSENRPQEASE